MLGNSPFFGLNRFAGMQVIEMDAQQQARTVRDVLGPRAWVRPKVPSKLAGRRGTRRAWKRHHSPHWAQTMLYREPTDVLVLGGTKIIATPLQMDALRRAIPAVY